MTSRRSSTSTPPSLRDLALDHLGALAAAIRAENPALSKSQAVAKAAQSPEGRDAYAIYKDPGAAKPWPEAVKQLAGLTQLDDPALATYLATRRADLLKGVSGSGPRDGRIEDPITSGRRAPADTLPDPAAAIMQALHEQALAAAPVGTSQAQATAAFLNTPEGAFLHRQYNAAMQAKREASSR